MPKISDVIRDVVADKRISREEWETQVKPKVAQAQVASPETREVLELWGNDEFEAEAGVRDDMRSLLMHAGYDIPKNAVPKKELVEQIAQSNITEIDKDFEFLLEQTGTRQNLTKVAVLDGGFQIEHPALGDNRWTNPAEIPDNNLDDDGDGLVDDVHGWDFAHGDKDFSGNAHGTHVAGIATRGTDRIQAMTLLAVDDVIEPGEVAAAIDYACAKGARVVNMSLKIDDEDEVLGIKEAIERHPDVLFVKSAGNDGEKLEEGWFFGDAKCFLPLNQIPNMLVVAASDAKGERARISNFGAPYATLAMRGAEVYSSVPDNGYESRDGTSMATPNVSAVAAKCLTLAPKLTPQDMRKILVDTSDRSDYWKDLCLAGGLVNQGRATRLAALIGLVQGHAGEQASSAERVGIDPQVAADRLELRGEERVKLLAMLAEYPVPAP
ncbi:MAG: S8 family serine peptidase [Deltaproteobacteria bacterium]|nr:S8 family serine peptidase [Deltaproteobacteria bacterium]